MGLKKRWYYLWVIAAIFMVSSSVQAEEGVTDTEIHIGQFGPLSGPAAAYGGVLKGTGFLIDIINRAGGIHGRRIVYHMADDAYDPVKTYAEVKKLQENTGIFAWVGGVGTRTGLAVKDYLTQKNVPWIGPCTGSSLFIEPPDKNIFFMYGQYKNEAKALTGYAIDQMEKKKLAIIYQEDGYGMEGLAGMREILTTHGLEAVAEIPLKPGAADIQSQVLSLRKAGSEAVLLWVSPVDVVRIMKTAQIMKFAPQWMTASTCGDIPVMNSISGGMFEGVITASFVELIDSDLPRMKKYREKFKQYASEGDRWSFYFCAGIGFAEPLIEALYACGKDLTRERLIKEMEQIKQFEGVLGKIRFAPFDPNDPATRGGNKEIFLGRCLKDSQIEKLTGWINVK